MSVYKHRINLSVSERLDRTLQRLATRDKQPVTTKALDLLTRAVEIEEDDVLLAVALRREKKKVKFVSHEKTWR